MIATPTSMSRVAIEVLKRSNPNIKTKGFVAALEKLNAERELGFEGRKITTRVPDGWFYEEWDDPKWPGTFTLIEIEDTHLLSVEKLNDYANLWFDLDSGNVGLKLFVYDRYGKSEREIDLHDVFYAFMSVKSEAA